ncbi:hypothetical protein T01_12780 [Trichinella spiralis]|uniref:FLYWCH-type domain-containing protein n=1 Tax=Trichinella spiralis TaxID=6334 RepID=A0A0V1C299_TRISP|nr:hypothetical protein T01_12780 [Trichinella spiralis]
MPLQNLIGCEFSVELRLVLYFIVVKFYCGKMSLVFEGKAYKLKHTGKQKKYWERAKNST